MNEFNLHVAFIEPSKCIRCFKCQAAKACPTKAIFRIDGQEPNIVEINICHGCGDCMSKCIGEAIILKTK